MEETGIENFQENTVEMIIKSQNQNKFLLRKGNENWKMIMLKKSKFNSTKEAIDINDVSISNILVSSKYHILLLDSADQTNLRMKIDTIFLQTTFFISE